MPALLGSEPRKTFSATLNCGTTDGSCPMAAIPWSSASRGERSETRSPRTSTEPPSGARTPAKIFPSVDLPAPFSPTSACTDPDRTATVASVSALVPPKCFETPRASRKAGSRGASDSGMAVLLAPAGRRIVPAHLEVPRLSELLASAAGLEAEHQDAGQRHVAAGVRHVHPELHRCPPLVRGDDGGTELHRDVALRRRHVGPVLVDAGRAEMRWAQRMILVDGVVGEEGGCSLCVAFLPRASVGADPFIDPSCHPASRSLADLPKD